MRAIDLLIDDYLPEDLRGQDRRYTKKEINDLISEVTRRDPDNYRKLAEAVKEYGRRSVYESGMTLTLDDLEPGFDRESILQEMESKVRALRSSGLSKAEQKNERIKIYADYAERLTKLAMADGEARGTNLAGAVASGARGNPTQYRAMLATPALYTDYKDEPIDMFVRRSFGDGIRPLDFLASTFGTRKAILATKRCLQKGTLVRMADGSEKAIEDIIVGDEVLGADINGHTFPAKVTKTYDQGIQPLVKLTFVNSTGMQSTICTEDHKLLSFGKRGNTVKRLCDFEHTALVAVSNAKGVGYRTIDKKTSAGYGQCYDIEVDTTNHLFVLSNGLIVSNSTADAGDLSKQLAQSALGAIVTHQNSLSDEGILLDPEEDRLRGRVLARDVLDYKRGTVIDREIEQDIRERAGQRVMVFSPLSEISDNGLSAQAFGVSYTGGLPPVGFAAGFTAANAIGEPIAQCLDGKTNVRMWDGTLKPIKDIEVGELVCGSNKEGILRPVKVLNKFYNGLQDCNRYVLDNKKSVICTAHHRWLTSVGCVETLYHTEQTLCTPTNAENANWKPKLNKLYRITKIVPIGTRDVYDLEVDHPDHLFVLEHDIITHNSSLNVKHCMAKDTAVLVRGKGEIPIQDIQIGDKVIGFDSTGAYKDVNVIDIIDQGVQNVYKYTFKRKRMKCSDISVTCTPDHKVLSDDGVKPIKDVTRIQLPLHSNVQLGFKEPLAFFAGMFLGDGIRWNPDKAKGAVLKVSCADPKLIEDFNAYYEKENLVMTKLVASFDCSIRDFAPAPTEPNALGQFTQGVRNKAKILIEKLGWKGSYAHEKAIPDEVFAWNRDSVAALISGFIATDGSIYKTNGKQISWGLSFPSCSKQLLIGLQQLLWVYFGVYTTVLTHIDKADAGNRKHDMWQFTITAGEELAKLVPHLNVLGCKADKLKQLREQVKPFAQKDAYAELTSVECIGTEPCFDITVDSDNSLFALANGMLVKNSGGAFSGTKKIFSGFDYIDQFVQVPDSFRDRASVSELQGRVTDISPAEQGGTWITVNDEKHYVLPGLNPTVKEGDEVEPGDILSEGLANPKDIIRLRGLGEGRKYFARRLKQLLDDSGQAADLRNTEVLAREIVDAVQITDNEGWEEHLPDSIVSYNRLAARWQPRTGYKTTRTDSESEGRFLEAPRLHYSIGTKLTPRMLAELKEAGYDSIPTHDVPPPFEPVQVRLRTTSFETSDDWLGRTSSSYLKINLAQSAQRGYDTNIKENLNPYPRAAFGEGFGQNTDTTAKF